jgi:hypothetical protein
MIPGCRCAFFRHERLPALKRHSALKFLFGYTPGVQSLDRDVCELLIKGVACLHVPRFGFVGKRIAEIAVDGLDPIPKDKLCQPRKDSRKAVGGFQWQCGDSRDKSSR